MANKTNKPDRRCVISGGAGALLVAAMPALSYAADGSNPNGPDQVSVLMQTLATYIAEAGEKPLPDAVTEATKQHVLDTIAAMVSGTQLMPGQHAIAYVRALGGNPQAGVPGTSIMTNAVNAALAGGILAHSDETDDHHEPSLTHPGCGVVAATLAMGQSVSASGLALLRAVALGYDVCTRLSIALGAYDFFNAGHSTHAYGPTFGAAAACGSLAGLNADRVRYLLSYAAQQASGISYQQRDKQHIEKAFDLGGMPARNGITAATMVASGMTGVDDAFSGERNFFFAWPGAHPNELIRDLGTRFEMMNTSIKKWTVGVPAQAPLDSISALMKSFKVRPDDVERIVIRLCHQGADVVSNRNIPDICVQHLAAIMLIDGTVTFASAHDFKRMSDPAVLALRRKVDVYGDDALDRVMPSRQAIVQITLRDGRIISDHTEEVRGSPKNPMSRDEVAAKATDLMSPVFGAKRTQDLVESIWRIDQVADIGQLRPMLMVEA